MLPNLEKLWAATCKPNPKYYTNHHEAALIFVKNKSLFLHHIAIVCLDFLFIPFFESTFAIKFRTAAFISTFLVFLLCARSHKLASQIYNTIILNAAGVIMHLSPEGVSFNVPVSYAAPLVVYNTTQHVGFTAVTCFVQLTTVLLTFKKNLIEAVTFSDPNEFAETFSKHFNMVSIPLQMFILFGMYDLHRKTYELAKETRRAEEALEQQKTFVYSFSHEMRNPMNSLLGNLELALMGNISSETREMIGTAKVCGLLLLNLINTVLDAGKLGLGKLEVSPVSTRVHDVFQRCWAISHDLITRKGLTSHLKISKKVPPRLILDSHRLNQVLMNLIGNSIKFTENGSITLAISWLEEPEVCEDCFRPIPYDEEGEGVFEKDYNLYALKRRRTGSPEPDQSLILAGGIKEFCLAGISQPRCETKGVLKIIIKDTGCGMAEEELGKLFQKFSQVGHVTTKRQMGTGLGLFISKEIIENMGGEIRVYSKPKVGTTFIVCIPTVALPIQSEQHICFQTHLIPKLQARKFTTLVADDSSFNVSLVCNFYSKVGAEVLASANNGLVAYNKYLEIVKNGGNIDVVTLDIDMPIMDGKQVCEKIRQYERENCLKRSVIILISGNYEEEEMHNLLKKENENKADCFLKKPLVFEEFCWALYKFGRNSN